MGKEVINKTTKTILTAKFDFTNTVLSVITGTAGKKINIVYFDITNNGTDYIKVDIVTLSGSVVYYYGGDKGSIFLQPGQNWKTPQYSPMAFPWFILQSGADMYINKKNSSSQRISGIVKYYLE